MKKLKLFMATMIFSSLSYSKDSFTNYADMCEISDGQECANNHDEVRNLQLALNADKSLNFKLDTDGKWGKETHEAVKKFQEKHHITPALGYVGAKTKTVLDHVSRNVDLPKIAHRSKKSTAGSNCYADFKRSTDLRKSYKVFKDNNLLCKANGKNTVVKVDVSEQRVKLLVNGKVALSAPCTTGAKHKLEPNSKTYRDKHTPLGSFKIMEKVAAKQSTIFGEMYRNGKKVYHGDRRKYRGPKAKYVGHTMHHWMRLTNGGIGMHASKYIKRHPGSNGCVRLPFKVAKTIFSKIKPGTKVMVVN